jgi:precorrin-6B methylase 1
MAIKAANEAVLGDLHARIADVFTKVLQTYEKRLDVIENIDPDQLTEDVLTLLMSDSSMPSPAMLSAITKFLKDNEIAFDVPELEALSATEERLQARRSKRGNLSTLTNLALVDKTDE